MLSVSDKCDSVNECTQEISKLMTLYIQGGGKMPINVLSNWLIAFVYVFVCFCTVYNSVSCIFHKAASKLLQSMRKLSV